MTPQRLPEQFLAVPVPISPGGVKEVAPELDGHVERFERLLVVRSRPAAHAPHAVANL
jgi:hypothetical protein